MINKHMLSLFLLIATNGIIQAESPQETNFNGMEKLTREDKEDILMRKDQMRFALGQSDWWFEGSSQTKGGAIHTQFRYIEKILDEHGIEYPEKGRYNPDFSRVLPWLHNFSENVKKDLQKEDLEKFKETGKCTTQHTNSRLYYCYLENTDLRETIKSLKKRGVHIDLEGAHLQGVNCAGCDLSEANLDGTNFEGADLSRAKFKGAELKNARFTNATVTDAQFDHNRRKFYGSEWTYGPAKNTEDITVYPEQEDIEKLSKTGQCECCALTNTDLRPIINSLNKRRLPINLERSYLNDSNLAGTNLSHANLERTHCRGTKFTNANLTGAKLGGGYFKNALFRNAILRNIQINSWQKINMQNADLTNADLRGVDTTKFTQ